ncbi:MAG: type II toxin-antitoxin system PemK/MazF family toxin [Acidimicrobiales bacterium]
MPPRPEPRRGEVWLVRLDKVRPAVVLTRDPMGSHLNSLMVAPVTSTERGIPTQVELTVEDGARRRSFAALDSTTNVLIDNFVRRVGIVRLATMDQICRALAFTVACNP